MTLLPVPEELKSETEAVLREIASFLPPSIQNYWKLAMLWQRLEKPEEVVASYRAALELEEESTLVLNNLASILGKDPMTRQEALQLIDRALDLEPNSPILLDTKALILLEQGTSESLQEAKMLLERATEIDPSLRNHQLHLAVAYLRSGEEEKAASILEQSLQDVEADNWSPSDQKFWEELQKSALPTS
jgi:Tfp pilus assembly protein PilF